LLTNNSDDILSLNVNNQQTQLSSKQISIEENLIELDKSLTKDQHLLTNSPTELNKSSQLIESENKEEEQLLLIKEKALKRNRRRRNNYFYSSKRRRKQQLKTNSNRIKSSFDHQQFWINKYSIEPFSIPIDRLELPIK
jgi:hypothetical protein